MLMLSVKQRPKDKFPYSNIFYPWIKWHRNNRLYWIFWFSECVFWMFMDLWWTKMNWLMSWKVMVMWCGDWLMSWSSNFVQKVKPCLREELWFGVQFYRPSLKQEFSRGLPHYSTHFYTISSVSRNPIFQKENVRLYTEDTVILFFDSQIHLVLWLVCFDLSIPEHIWNMIWGWTVV